MARLCRSTWVRISRYASYKQGHGGPYRTEQQVMKMSVNAVQQASAAGRQEFVGFFSQIVQDLTEDGLHHPEVGDAIVRLKEVLEYMAPGGKLIRGLMVVAAFRELVGPEFQKPGNLQRVLAVGWCIELLQAFTLVADDIMDHGSIRRGKLCWYKKEGVGLSAINDAFLLEACVYRLLKKYCSEQPYYLKLLELFLQASYKTELGQSLDMASAEPGKVDLSQFTEQRLKAIAKYKTAIFTFYLPVATAMYMAGIDGEEEHEPARAISLEMGEFYQIQNDYLDCYGDPSVMGKVGGDIADNKCVWPVVEALARASPEQRQILQENYGQDDPAKVSRVKQLYEDLGMQSAYLLYEEQSYIRLQHLIEMHATSLSKDIFLTLAAKLYKRQK